MSIGDWLTVVWIIVTVAGLVFTYRQFKRGKQAEGARFLLDLATSYFADEGIRGLFARLDHDEFKFEQQKFAEPTDEFSLDRLLYTFDLLGRMVRLGILQVTEVEIIVYPVLRVMNHTEVQKYLNYLDNEYKNSGINRNSHEDARFLAEQLRSIHGGGAPAATVS